MGRDGLLDAVILDPQPEYVVDIVLAAVRWVEGRDPRPCDAPPSTPAGAAEPVGQPHRRRLSGVLAVRLHAPGAELRRTGSYPRASGTAGAYPGRWLRRMPHRPAYRDRRGLARDASGHARA